MDCALGIAGKDFVIVATDCTVARSIVAFKHDEVKCYDLDEHKVLATAGDHASRTQFAEYIQRNIALMRIKDDFDLSNHGCAHFIRRTLAEALRSRGGAFQCNSLLGGVDGDGAELYYLDYLGSLQRVEYSAQGYCSNFSLSIMDKQYKPNLTKEEGRKILLDCIAELKVRFLVHLPKFQIKTITAEGISEEFI